MLVERRLSFSCTGFMAISMGMVTNFSTSSALRPGHWVMISISVFVTSGNASMGILMKVITPVTINREVIKMMKYLFFSENPIMPRRNLVMESVLIVQLIKDLHGVLGDDSLSLGNTVSDIDLTVHRIGQRVQRVYRSDIRFAVAVVNQYIIAAGLEDQRRFRNIERLLVLGVRDVHAGEHQRTQGVVGVVYNDADLCHAAIGVENVHDLIHATVEVPSGI